MVKSDLFIRALLLDRILVTEKTTRTPRVHLVIGIFMGFMTLWVLSDVVKISKFVEFLYGYVILTY